MSKIDVRIARSMRMLHTPEMAPILEYLKAERQEAMEVAVQANDMAVIRKAQGKAEFIKRFLEHVNDDTLVTKFR